MEQFPKRQKIETDEAISPQASLQLRLDATTDIELASSLMKLGKDKLVPKSFPLAVALKLRGQGGKQWVALFKHYRFLPEEILPIELYEKFCNDWNHFVPLFILLILTERKEDALRIYNRMREVAAKERLPDKLWQKHESQLDNAQKEKIKRFFPDNGIVMTKPLIIPLGISSIEPDERGLHVLILVVDRFPNVLLSTCRLSIHLWHLLPRYFPNLTKGDLWLLWISKYQRKKDVWTNSKKHIRKEYLQLIMQKGAGALLAQFSKKELDIYLLEAQWAEFFAAFKFNPNCILPLELYQENCRNWEHLVPLFLHLALQPEEAMRIWITIQKRRGAPPHVVWENALSALWECKEGPFHCRKFFALCAQRGIVPFSEDRWWDLLNIGHSFALDHQVQELAEEIWGIVILAEPSWNEEEEEA